MSPSLGLGERGFGLDVGEHLLEAAGSDLDHLGASVGGSLTGLGAEPLPGEQ